jgi:mannobiose 2-epimerase
VLRTHVLDAWYPRAIDTESGGYFSNFGYDWERSATQDKMIVTQARHVWTTARAATFFPEERQAYLDMAAHGVRFLRDHMWDEQYGGFQTLVSRDGAPRQTASAYTQGKTAYGNAFAIYALVAYHKASGDQAALALAQRTFRWLETHAHDAEYGGYFQFIQRDGTALMEGRGGRPPKDQNSSIHLLEAFTELYSAWPDPLLRDRLEALLVLIRDTLTTDAGYLRLFFERDWTPVSQDDPQGAAGQGIYEFDHISYGHDVETAFLMVEAAVALGLDSARTLTAAKQMVDHTLASGWDDRRGGIFNGGRYFAADPSAKIIDDGKAWWAQAEALNALLLMADYYPEDDQRYYERFLSMWNYIEKFLLDEQHGGWYQAGLDQEPNFKRAPKGSVWKGAYHDGRALMNVATRLSNRTRRPSEPESSQETSKLGLDFLPVAVFGKSSLHVPARVLSQALVEGGVAEQ